MPSRLNQSPDIDLLIPALIDAEAAFKPLMKTELNPHFKAKYADLHGALNSCRSALAAQGLVILQSTALADTDGARREESTNKQGEVRATETRAREVVLVTRLCHTSGQWIEGEYPVRPARDDPQGMGGAITYARRYALMALVGLAPEDDDAEQASGRGGPPRGQRQREPAPQSDGADRDPVRPWAIVAQEIVTSANDEWHIECRERGIVPTPKWKDLLVVFQLNQHFATKAVEKGLVTLPVKRDAAWAASVVSSIWRKTPNKLMAAVKLYLAGKFAEARTDSMPGDTAGATDTPNQREPGED